jgi:hypothetical protein
MSELTVFSAGAMPVPAHIASFVDERETNLIERNRIPTLNYAGKVWSISLPDGSRTNLTRRNEDGDSEPVQTLRVIVMDYAKHRGRAYYEGAYDPEKISLPACWSDDGEKPSAQVAEPKSASCRTCPLAAKGSKITEAGKAVTACSQQRHIVVLPLVGEMKLPPLRLKLAITSLFDKQSPDLEKEGWRAFENYVDFLRGNGAKHTATIVTKMRFDPNANYPKVIFSAERWLEPHEMEVVKARMEDGSVESLLAVDEPAAAPALPAGSPDVKAAEVEQAPAPAAKREPEPAAKPRQAAKPAAKAESKPAKPAAKPAKPAPEPEDDDQIEMSFDAGEPEEAASAPAAAAETTEVPKELQDLLAEWDD